MARLIFSVVFMTRTTGAFPPLSFHRIDLVWGPHTVDRFASHVNAKLPGFNSRFWNPEGIDAFVMLREIVHQRLSCLGIHLATPRSNNESWEEGLQTILPSDPRVTTW